MDRLNDTFQEILEERGFSMKIVPSDKQVSYHGRLALTDEAIVNFALLVPRSDDKEIVQIVFDKLIACSDDKRDLCLDTLNHLNVSTGLYYYFALRENGDVFARYMIPVEPDRTEVLLELIQTGGRLMRQAHAVLSEVLED